jgi:hypothetical protein
MKAKHPKGGFSRRQELLVMIGMTFDLLGAVAAA